MTEASEQLERRIAAPAPLVWALVADTNRFDRAAGLTAGTYSFRELPDGRRERVARAKQAGFDIEWIEPAYDWIEGRFVRGRRTFVAGPPKSGGFSVELTPDGESTIVKARAWVAGDGVLGFVARTIMRPQFRTALRRYLDAIEKVLREARPVYDWAAEPPAAAARRALMTQVADEVTTGVRTPNDETSFTFRARKLKDAPIDPDLRDKLVEYLRSRSDEEVATLRPFEVAGAWGADRRETLRVFLHAARAGLLELEWQINCPTCRVGAQTASNLKDVGRQGHCDACQIEYDLDFAEHVEAIFRVSPSIRKVETAVYCASSPWFRPHVFAQLSLEPGQTVTLPAELPPGIMLVRTLRKRRRGQFLVGERQPERVRIAFGEELVAEASGVAENGDARIELHNESDRAETVLLERTGWNADIVLGSVIATFPDFLDLFATEAPASGVELTVSTMTVLFSDLTGSTALYQRVGDARAYAIVGEHFRDMTRAVAEAEGAIVKTMGDAVMATFASPAAALDAAYAMVRECERAHGGLGLSVKIGLHEGPCLAVRANDRLDFFGTTVNLSARLQAQAKGSEVVVTEAMLDHEGVRAKVGARPLRRFTASLKGIDAEQQLVGIDASGRP
ncbi:MAG: adenylate/guanylate cyclase domain-containing protein [Myxococcales bacterium]|nr:adenylate/guanylate cyclase domain-containing protein [Myxococcales bacterium]